MEIERKWLIKEFPFMPHYGHYWIKQSYIAVHDDCEARVRWSVPASDNNAKKVSPFKFTFKTNGGLSRMETEREISQDEYLQYIMMIGKPAIEKDYYTYLVDNHKIEVSQVDNEWYYAEVEFNNEIEARGYQFPWPELVIEEVTYDNKYRMKNYWVDTRLNQVK